MLLHGMQTQRSLPVLETRTHASFKGIKFYIKHSKYLSSKSAFYQIWKFRDVFDIESIQFDIGFKNRQNVKHED